MLEFLLHILETLFTGHYKTGRHKMIYYVVKKGENDAWLIQGSQVYNETNRPWARKFTSLEEAVDYADRQPNKDNLEIETDEDDEEYSGAVLGYEDENWVEVFT